MMKRFLACVLALMLLCGAALAEGIPFADPGVNLDAFARYADYAPDANGDYAVKCARASALESLFAEKLQAYAANGYLCFFAEVRGNVHTRAAYPALTILYTGYSALNARAVSFAFGGKRYDLAVSTETVQVGRYRVEKLSAYLDAAGMAFLKELAAAESAYVCLMGDTQYIQQAEAGASYTNQRLELAGESFKALRLPDGAPDFAAYPFEALTRAAYKAQTGVEPQMAVSDVNAQTPAAGDARFGLIITGAPGASVRAARELLTNAGFLAGAQTTLITNALTDAVRRAQTYYGLIPTGCADAALLNLLANGAGANPAGDDKTAPAAYACAAPAAAFTLSRWWTADAAETTLPGGGRARADQDHTLVIAEGEIRALGAQALSLSWEAGATLTYNGQWTFAAQMYAEANGGRALSTSLGVLDRARLLVLAEVPEYLLCEEGEWALQVKIGEQTFDLPLDR